jgi:hypothetical protein
VKNRKQQLTLAVSVFFFSDMNSVLLMKRRAVAKRPPDEKPWRLKSGDSKVITLLILQQKKQYQ